MVKVNEKKNIITEKISIQETTVTLSTERRIATSRKTKGIRTAFQITKIPLEKKRTGLTENHTPMETVTVLRTLPIKPPLPQILLPQTSQHTPPNPSLRQSLSKA